MQRIQYLLIDDELITFRLLENSNSQDDLFSFLFNRTSEDLFSVNEQVLYDYIRYHANNNFKERTLTNVIKDIKKFVRFQKQKGIEPPNIDLSTLNLQLWLNL